MNKPTHEQEVLNRYSTPGLRKNKLDRAAKKRHLESRGIKEPQLSEIINELYPPRGKDE